MGVFKQWMAMRKTGKEYNRLREMAVRYLESPEGRKEDPNLKPHEWIMGVLLAEKLYSAGEIDEETINSIPGYYRD